MERIEGQIIEWSAPSSLVDELVPAGGPEAPDYLVAVSGGIDSMCLADLSLRHFGAGRIAIAHCNFHLRGEESDGDEAMVASWAEKAGVKMFRTDFDTEGYALKHGVSIEMAARDLRYSWFAGLCREHGFVGVMTAHNANDNAETLILNLLRGAGLHGVTGMSEVGQYRDAHGEVKVLRPLLTVTRKEIEGYVFAWKIPYRTDSTNAMSDYKRNRIRNEVFPHFEKINPSFVRTLNRETGYFAEAAEIVDDWCRRRAERYCRHDDGEADMVMDIDAMKCERHWRYLLYYVLEPYGFHSAVIASVEKLIGSDRTFSGKRFESDEYMIVTGRGVLKVFPRTQEQASLPEEPVCVVRGAGTYHFNGRTFRVEILPLTFGMSLKQPAGSLIFDAGRLAFPFVCRKWNAGDWFIPFGMKGKKKVSDFFADMKYDVIQKDRAVIAVDCRDGLSEVQHIAAVLGHRIDDRYKVTCSTERIIRITDTTL